MYVLFYVSQNAFKDNGTAGSSDNAEGSPKFRQGTEEEGLVIGSHEKAEKRETSNSKLQDRGVLGRAWYAGDIERREAERRLRRINKDGCFLVRLSSAQKRLQPYTLALLCKDNIYNIPIRAVGSRGYTLGKEGKRNEKIFPSVVHLIEHYQHEHMHVVNRQTQSRESTLLLYPGLA
ncbi:SH2 domain-containing protein 6 [Bombina bombina]|uniref:SH2 domain-containing protein 6 n=1 Tax=Bombina bombina TaxID=8345 RepID=UPI00235AC7BF|nr:SH2 domain-containing protein 6 [Bombina bombina]